MADYNMHFRNIHLQNLVDQNQDLRRRVAKLTEIEGYVQLLVDKLEKAQRKQHTIVNQNNILRQQLREIEVKYSQSENMHGDQMRYVFSQHDKLIQEKNLQLLQLKSYMQKENVRSGQLQNQYRIQKTHQQKIVSEYEQTLLKYRNRVVQLERDIQIIFQTLQEQKILHSKTKESWISQSNQFKMAMKQLQIHIAQLNQHISQLKEQCSLLSNANEKLQNENHSYLEYNQKLESKFRYSEQENAATITHLNSNLTSLQEKLLLKTSQNQNLQNNNANLLSEIENLKKVQLHLKSDNQVYVTDNQKLIFLLEESDKENSHLREKHAELEDYSSVEIEKAKIDNLRLREENNVLNKNNSQRENYLSGKLIELKEATAARNNLQILNDQVQRQVISLREELQMIQDSLIKEKKLSTELQIERKQLNQAVMLLKQHSLKVEQMNQKIQKQNHDLSKTNHQMTRLLSNPRQLNKEYVEQIDKILKNFHQERQQQSKRHWIQKQKLKQMYQYEFKQKQMQMLRQISLLQQQLAKVNKFEILTERTFNKITPTKTPTKPTNKF